MTISLVKRDFNYLLPKQGILYMKTNGLKNGPKSNGALNGV